jgi:glutamate 5-kinase
MDVVPIINENDSVAVEELKVGDNDTLGSLIASLAEADLFINLTNRDGFLAGDPAKEPQATVISQVSKLDLALMEKAGAKGGPLGTGGMLTKVMAAGRLAERGMASLIANGQTRDILLRIILGGEDLGTFFTPSAKPRGARKHWLAFAARPKGRLFLDKGATQALLERGKSLLPKGITGLSGLFAEGDAVTLAPGDGEADLGVGLVNYSSPDLSIIMGHSSQEIEKLLGYCRSEEAVHRDNLVIFRNQGKA